MATESEYVLEKNLIKQLCAQGYEFIEVNDEASLKVNLRQQINDHNRQALGVRDLTDDEFRQVLLHLESGTRFQKAQKIRDKFSLKRQSGVVYLEFFNTKDWCQNTYQVANQITMTGKRKNRYDVTLLINGLPLVQIELKRRGLEMKEAFNQTKRYSQESYRGLFQTIQLFVISNGVNTKYYANNPKQNFKQTFYWTDKNNHRLSDLHDFTAWFLEKCYVSKIIAKYIVLNQTEKCLMVLRPYQFYAVEEIIHKVEQNCGNGYIWHTTGSGKTLTAFKASQILQAYDKVAKIIFVVDRKDLDSQTFREFNAFEKDCVDRTDKTGVLINYLNDPTKKLVITTIQKLNKAVTTQRFAEQITSLKHKKIVMIFDECHRSQFGQKVNEGMHFNIIGNQDKPGFFINTQIFGFTGTPILAFNAKGTRTTKTIFGQCLHQYLIKDAIADDNVLGFSVEYIRTIKRKEDTNDEQVEAIDKQEVFTDPQHIDLVIDHILRIHIKKTQDKRFTALFTVSSIPILLQYYKAFKTKPHSLNIAAIFSFDTNEDDQDETGQPLESSRDALEEIIMDYNNRFGTHFGTDTFSGYALDVAKRFKKDNSHCDQVNQIDILLVVNMFLTGYDSKPLNTLYVDKNLEAHGLVQAFSRTNRIFNENKTYGNIVCFRNLKEKTDKALTEFSNKDALDTVLMKPYADYLAQFEAALENLKSMAPDPSAVDGMQSETQQKVFVESFRAVMRSLKRLEMFSDFAWQNLSITEQCYADYNSKYLDIYQRVQKSHEKTSILHDVAFEIELLHHDRINVDYILALLKHLKPSSPSYHKDRETLLKEIDSSPTLKSKRALIAKFIDDCLPSMQKSTPVDDALSDFADQEKKSALLKLAHEEKLDENKLLQLVQNYEYSNKLNHADIKPTFTEPLGVVARTNKVKRIKSALIALIDQFRW